MSDLSPQREPKRIDLVAVTNRDFMSTRPIRSGVRGYCPFAVPRPRGRYSPGSRRAYGNPLRTPGRYYRGLMEAGRSSGIGSAAARAPNSSRLYSERFRSAPRTGCAFHRQGGGAANRLRQWRSLAGMVGGGTRGREPQCSALDAANSSRCSVARSRRGRSRRARNNRASECGGSASFRAASTPANRTRRPTSQRFSRDWSNWAGPSAATCGSIIAGPWATPATFASTRRNWPRSRRTSS